MTETRNSTSFELHALSVNNFYGVKVHIHPKTRETEKIQVNKRPLPHRLNNLFGPTHLWEVFQKQNDALKCAKTKRSGVMTFAFQQSDGTRLFLVAHPQIFWHYDVQKNASQRCSYEIIPESTVCKLYFDLEFDVEYNPGKDGPLVVDTFISVVVYFLSILLKINASREQILDLDSSTDRKFSRHLIFQLSSHVFSDNKSVGEFVHLICQKLKFYCNLCDDVMKSKCSDDQPSPCKCCQLTGLKNTGCIKETRLSTDSLQNLIVFDRKGKKGLVCDETVYSRNRHFRLFQNTKWGKNAPLTLSESNGYKPLLQPEAEVSSEILTETFFLDSLVSNIRFQQKTTSDVKVVHFKSPLSSKIKSQTIAKMSTAMSFLAETSPYSDVDKFINAIVFPGHIWRNAYFSSSSVIVYDVVGNRYCQNIGRQHRSNNVKYIVNLDNYTYYQKCHDPDCSSFRSNPLPLPPELKFKLEDDCFVTCDLSDSVKLTDDFTISDSDLMEVADVIEDLSTVHSEEES